MWEEWFAAAKDSLSGARVCEREAFRSAASRYYYAAYHAATAILHYLEVTPPAHAPGDAEAREAWSHAVTPVLLERHLEKYEVNAAARRRLRQKMELLYRARIDADYHPAVPITRIPEFRKASESLVKYAEELITEGRVDERTGTRRNRR